MTLARPIVLDQLDQRRTVVRIPRAAYRGLPPPSHEAVIVSSAGDAVDLLVSPAMRRGISNPDSILADSQRLAEASFVAEARGQYIWDLDVAIADGCAANDEAVRMWRRMNNVEAPSRPWPAAWDAVDAEAEVAEARRTIGRLRDASQT
jgi:hypothetical protein